MKFDWTLSMGNLLTAGALFIGFFIAHQQNIKKLQDIETKVTMMYEWFQRKIIHRNMD